MNKLHFLSINTLFCFLLSCTAENHQNSNESLLIEKAGDTLKNKYAETFRIIKYSDFTEIQIINPENQEVDFSYVIGKEVDGKPMVDSDLQRVVALSSTHIGMMEKLNLENKIVGISGEQYLCSDYLKKEVAADRVSSIGDIGMADVEGYLAVKPDIIMFSGFDTKTPVLQKLKSAGLITFANYDWKETHPLGRAEWLIVFGVLFDEIVAAQEKFSLIEKKYLDLKTRVKQVRNKPELLVGTIYGDIFNAPAGESYMAKMLSDARADYKYNETEGVGSLSLSMEEVITENRNTEFWLNVAAQSNSAVLKLNDKFKLLRSLKEDNIYSYYHDVNCFWEKSAVEPHLVLEDICKILYPSLFEDNQLNFYQKLK